MKKRLYLLALAATQLPLAAFADGKEAEPTGLTGLYVLAGAALVLSLAGLIMALRNRGGHIDIDSDEFQHTIRAIVREEINRKLKANAAKDNAEAVQSQLAELSQRVEAIEQRPSQSTQQPQQAQPTRPKTHAEGFFGIFKGTTPPFFNDFHTAKRGESMFSATIDGDECEFWPIDLNRLKGRDVKAAVELKGAKLDSAADMNVEAKGHARRDDHGYWVVSTKATVNLI